MSHPFSRKLSFRIYKYLFIILLLLLSLLLRYIVTINKEFVPDEFQHIQASWLIFKHYVPYSDFWENHTPFFHFFVAALFNFLPESPSTVIILRLILILPVILIFYLINLFMKSRYDITVFLYALLLLGFHKWFVDKSCEIRPDVILVVFSLAGLYFWIIGWDFYKRVHIFYSGIFIGLGFITSPKVSVLVFSMVLSFLIHLKTGRRLKEFKAFMMMYFYFILGVLIPVIFLILYLYFNNALGQFFHCLYTGVLKNPNHFSPASYVRKSFFLNFIFWVTGVMGIVYYLYIYFNKYFNFKQNSIYHITITSAIICQYFVFHWFMPAPYPQSALVIFPLMSIYGGLILFKLEEILRKWRKGFRRLPLFTFILLLVIVPPLYSYIVTDKIFENKNGGQKEKIEFILDNTKPDSRIFDCQGFYIFRKPASYYGVLVKGVLISMERGLIQYDITSDLIKNRCSMAIPDYRWSMLPEDIIRFFENNFVMISKKGVLVPGKIFYIRDIEAEIEFELPLDLPYTLSAIPNVLKVEIDGSDHFHPPFSISYGAHSMGRVDGAEKIIILPDFTLLEDFDIMLDDDISKAILR